MQHVLSLIAAKPKESLTEGDAALARNALKEAGASAAPAEWLSPDEAVELAFQGNSAQALAAVRAALAGRAIDINVVPADFRRKRLLVADMDSTLIEQECIDELADEIGARAQVAAITERAMRGEIAFEPALRERVALFQGLAVDVVERLLAERIRITPGAKTLAATMRNSGAHTALVSGGFTVFTGPVAQRIGFAEQRANTLLQDAGSFTGFVAEPILGSAAKEEALIELTEKLGLDPAETMAVGDGANDLAMIRRAGLGVAYRAKPLLRDSADAIIDHADLTALLFLQGFRRQELAIVADA